MTLQQLEYIVAVANQQSFSKAAAVCFVTQPTLSMQIQKLEETLGATLFDRSKKPVIPTAVGAGIIAIARNILQERSRLESLVRDAKGQLSGDLRVGIIPTVAPYLIPLFLTEFLEEFPEINLVVSEMTTGEIIEKLKRDQLDGGILVTPLSDPHIKEVPLYYEPFVAYVSSQSLMYREHMLSPKEMDLSEIWLLNEGHCMQSQVINLCYERRKRRLVPNFEYQAGSIETLRKLVELNKGATLLPALALSDLNENQLGMVRYFEAPEPVREVSMVTHRTYVKKSLIEALCNSVRKSIPPEMQSVNGRKLIEVEI